jgi:hypothetical protein
MLQVPSVAQHVLSSSGATHVRFLQLISAAKDLSVVLVGHLCSLHFASASQHVPVSVSVHVQLSQKRFAAAAR